MFRLAMLTGFCYVNRPLVRFDRSPAEIRHVGVSSDWNKLEFWLRDSQLRLEGAVALERRPCRRKIRKLIREQLGSVHSGWTNWYLETGQYEKRAKQHVESSAIRPDVQHRSEMAADVDESPTGAPNCAAPPGNKERKGFGSVRMSLAPIPELDQVADREDGAGPKNHGPELCPICCASGSAGVAAGTGPVPRQAGAVHAAALPGAVRWSG